MIYNSGATIQYIDLICTGSVNFISEHRDGSSLMLHVLKTGDLLGCSAAVPKMNQTYSADIVGMSTLTRIQFPLDCIKKVCDLNARFYQSIRQQAQTERDHLLNHLISPQ
jgi:signal-transduction protein with cAMP-binding, CBS, and nucleotidyltransferase domain